MRERKLIRVREVMKTQFDMVNGMATVAEALQQMHHVETKSLIVDKRQEDDEYGMVMLSDISREVLALDRAPDRVNIYEIKSGFILKKKQIRFLVCYFYLDYRNPVTPNVLFDDFHCSGICIID